MLAASAPAPPSTTSTIVGSSGESSRPLCACAGTVTAVSAKIQGDRRFAACIYTDMIRKLKSGQFRLYSRKKNPETGKRRNLGTFSTLAQAKQHEREVQYFKRH